MQPTYKKYKCIKVTGYPYSVSDWSIYITKGKIYYGVEIYLELEENYIELKEDDTGVQNRNFPSLFFEEISNSIDFILSD